MAFILSGTVVTSNGPTDGATVYAWAASRFATAPVSGSVPPGGLPDAGPITTGGAYGAPGAFQITVPTGEPYWLEVEYGAASTSWQYAVPATGEVVYSVIAWGAKGDGVTDDSAAFTAAIAAAQAAGGGTVAIPPGTFVVQSLQPVQGVRIHGSGKRATVLRAAAPNVPIFAAPAATCDLLEIGGFSVQPHVSGSTGPAIQVATTSISQRFSRFHDIDYIGNGTGAFNSMFMLVGASYYNSFDDISVDAQTTGPVHVFLCSNGGLGAAYNPNENYIRGLHVYAVNGITTIVDAGDSAGMHLIDCGIESNTGAVVLIPGKGTTWHRGWCEANAAAPITPLTTRSLSPNACMLAGVYFAGSPTLTIPSGVTGWDVSCIGLSVVDNGGSSLVRSGSTLQMPGANGKLNLQNPSAGGGNFSFLVNSTGGSFPGALAIEDMTAGTIPVLMRGGAPSYVLMFTTQGVLLRAPVTTVTASTTLVSSASSATPHHYVLCNATAAITVTLPSSPDAGRPLTIKDIAGTAGTYNVTVTPSSGTIDGGTSYVINTNYGRVTLLWDATSTNWHVIG